MAMMTRRDWLGLAGATTMAAWAGDRVALAGGGRRAGRASAFSGTDCLFSKHLPDLGWDELGREVKAAGFGGVDLTVRPKGHVLPEKAAADLPRAIEALARHGVTVPMITTEITTADDPTARPLLTAAAQHGVRSFKVGYWRYTSADVRADVATAGRALQGLAALARDCGLTMGFHNHAGNVGGALWDIAPEIDRLDPRWTGYYFDPRHAAAEGGGGAWKTAMQLVAPRLKMVAVKDCLWEKGEQGWRIVHCPLGQGIVDWAWAATALRQARYDGPISLHLEYAIPGATPQERTRRTLDAAIRDLGIIRGHLDRAFGS
jgi:sugar phosphate isomerase/epimerase